MFTKKKENRWVKYEIKGFLLAAVYIHSSSQLDRRFSDGSNIKIGWSISDHFWTFYLIKYEIKTQRLFKLFFDWYLPPNEKKQLDNDIKNMLQFQQK